MSLFSERISDLSAAFEGAERGRGVNLAIMAKAWDIAINEDRPLPVRLSALVLLNSAQKNKELKDKVVPYETIKGQVVQLAYDNLFNKEVGLFYNEIEHCTYFLVDEVQFSFHFCKGMCKYVENLLKKLPKIEFDGIRKQTFATELLIMAEECYK